MKISNTKRGILLGTLFFPLFLAAGNLTFDSFNFSINIYYYFIIFLFSSTLILLSPDAFHIKKDHQVGFFSLSVLLVIVTLNYDGVRYLMPAFFVSYLILIYRVSEYKTSLNQKNFYYIAFLYLVFSVVFLFFNSSWQLFGRFSGFTGSGTTYSIFLIAIVILIIRSPLPRVVKILFYLLGLVLVTLTLTRLNLVFYLLLPGFNLISTWSKVKRFSIMIVYIIGLNLIYPGYDLLSKKYPELIQIRYSDGRDASFGLRVVLFNEVYDHWSSPNSNRFFGNGLENARGIIVLKHGLDLLPHNDFLRLLNDIGIIGFAIFLFWLLRTINSNRTTFLLGLLYLLSFYHNMVYNFFLITIIVLSSSHDPFLTKPTSKSGNNSNKLLVGS